MSASSSSSVPQRAERQNSELQEKRSQREKTPVASKILTFAVSLGQHVDFAPICTFSFACHQDAVYTMDLRSAHKTLDKASPRLRLSLTRSLDPEEEEDETYRPSCRRAPQPQHRKSMKRRSQLRCLNSNPSSPSEEDWNSPGEEEEEEENVEEDEEEEENVEEEEEEEDNVENDKEATTERSGGFGKWVSVSLTLVTTPLTLGGNTQNHIRPRTWRNVSLLQQIKKE